FISFSMPHPPPRATLFPYTTLFRSEGARNHGEPRQRQAEGDVLAGDEDRDRRAQRRGREHRVLERPEREDARDGALAVLACCPQRPVVDGEAAARPRRGEDAEAADDRADRGAEAELRP